jgi:CheY-like chemotaxis protein
MANSLWGVQQTASASFSAVQQTVSGRRLLLVDDDEQTAFLVRRSCREMAGLTLETAPDVDAGWAAVRAGRPDLVLLDVNLPGRSGLDLLRLRDAGGVERFSIALFCQAVLDRDVAAGWRAGADYLVAKELLTRPAGWRRRIGEILDHAHGQQPPCSLEITAEGSGLLLSDWGGWLNRALDHPASFSPVPGTGEGWLSLGAEVVEEVLRRALRQGLGESVADDWLVPGAGRLAAGRLPPAPSVEAVHRCFASIRDQLWRLLGSGQLSAFGPQSEDSSVLGRPADGLGPGALPG